MNEEITINLNDLTQVISELESVNVKFDNEIVHKELNQINENLAEIFELLSSEEEVEDYNIDLLENEIAEDQEEDLYLKELETLNSRMLSLTEEIKKHELPNEFRELQIKGYGSNIIILYLLVFYGLVKFVSFIFKFVSNNI